MITTPLTRAGRRHAIEWAFYAATVLLVVAMAGYALMRERRGIEVLEADRLKVQARVVSANLLQQFDGIDKGLAGVRDDFFSGARSQGVPVLKSRRLKALTEAVPGLAVMLVLDAQGTVVAASNPALVGRNFAEREYFSSPRSRPDRDTLYISRPFKAINGVWTMGFSRVLTDEQGRFAGVVMAGLSNDHFSVILNSVLATDDMRTTLVHGDGIVFMNAPLNPRTLGADLNGPATFFTRHRLSGRTETLLAGHVQAINEDRLIASRTIAAPTLRMDRPLVIHVSRELGTMYAGWRFEALRLLGVLAALMAGGAVALVLVQRRRREFEALWIDAQKEREAASRRIRTITDNLPAMVAYVDRTQRYRFANAATQAILGVSANDLLGQHVAETVGPEVYAELQPHIEAVLRGEPQHFERHRVAGGQDLHLVLDYVPEFDADQQVQGFYVMVSDITARKRAELERAASEKLVRTITDNLPVTISYVDAQERVRFLNATFGQWTGIDIGAAIGKPLVEVIGPELYAQRVEPLRRSLAGERVEFELESIVQGAELSLHKVYVPDVLDDGRVAGVVTLSNDTTALKRVERQLVALARYDTLTGLPNRHQFNEKLAEALARTQRRGDAMALMFLDVDHFKSINDTLGHAAGDAVLKEFALRLQTSVRDTDCVARLAGDEFVVILEGLHDASEPERIAHKILAQVGGGFSIDGEPLRLSTSIGIAFHGQGTISPHELLDRADKALYEAKAAGRNTFRRANTPA